MRSSLLPNIAHQAELVPVGQVVNLRPIGNRPVREFR